jgi:hypothetical protein
VLLTVASKKNGPGSKIITCGSRDCSVIHEKMLPEIKCYGYVRCLGAEVELGKIERRSVTHMLL